jgi:hypothetical protein
MHLQSLAPTNLHWARVVDYGQFSLCVIYKEGLCPGSGGINRLMMMMMNRVLIGEFFRFTLKKNYVFVFLEDKEHYTLSQYLS